MGKIIAKDRTAARAARAIEGLKLHFANGSQVLPLAGGAAPTSVTDLATALGLIVSLRATVVSAKASAAARIAAETAQLPALVALLDALVAFVKLTLGASPNALADFGVAARKARTPMTAEAKAVAAARRVATRQARGTKGPKAKAAIHGHVTATLVVTPVVPATPAAPAAPAAGKPTAGA